MIRKTILASSILGVGLLIGACGNQTQTQMNSTNTSESSQSKVTESVASHLKVRLITKVYQAILVNPQVPLQNQKS